MGTLFQTVQGSWVSSQLSQEEIRREISKAQVVLTDLDDTDAVSPAKILAREHVQRGAKHHARYLSWVVRSSWKKYHQGKSSETEIWKEYVDTFLKSKSQRIRAGEYFDERNVQQLLFPGVQDFYRALPPTYKSYITRNISEVARAFSSVVGIDSIVAETPNKGIATEQFIQSNPWFQNYIIKGDSEEDEEMMRVAEHYKKKGSIKTVTSILVCENKNTPLEKATIHIGRDYRGLVELMTSKKQAL